MLIIDYGGYDNGFVVRFDVDGDEYDMNLCMMMAMLITALVCCDEDNGVDSRGMSMRHDVNDDDHDTMIG